MSGAVLGVPVHLPLSRVLALKDGAAVAELLQWHDARHTLPDAEITVLVWARDACGAADWWSAWVGRLALDRLRHRRRRARHRHPLGAAGRAGGMSFRVPNQYRLRTGHMASDERNGNNGVFFVPTRPGQPPLKVIASDGALEDGSQAWEHVSVSLPNRCPTWAEMCAIKALFWGPEDTVVQYHPPRSDYVNNHPYCLHLWRPVDAELPRPPALMVGIVA